MVSLVYEGSATYDGDVVEFKENGKAIFYYEGRLKKYPKLFKNLEKSREMCYAIDASVSPPRLDWWSDTKGGSCGIFKFEDGNLIICQLWNSTGGKYPTDFVSEKGNDCFLSTWSRQNPYRLPGVDLKQRVIWGSECISPDGFGLAFGGQDQEADDGQPHTRILVDGKWVAIHDKLRAGNFVQQQRDEVWAIRDELKDLAARVRALHFEGRSGKLPDSEMKRVQVLGERMQAAGTSLRNAINPLPDDPIVNAVDLYPAFALRHWSAEISREAFEDILNHVRTCERVAAALDCEPPPRANSPLVFEPKTKLFVMFGGDHLDYLTNDTWVFDPIEKRWSRRWTNTPPAPRANHSWKVMGDGKLVMTGGYTYSSNTDYVGGQYRDLDKDWVFDVAENIWSKNLGNAGIPHFGDDRTYRTGPFDPEWYYTGSAYSKRNDRFDPKWNTAELARPNPKEVVRRLGNLPANKWVAMEPPRLPRLNRDWGTAILDPDRDLILRYSGGHSAHGGTDVLHYHLATNRWELTMPVEFPLGQLYTNTEYPDGFNFNMRPWITGHTYQRYGYDPLSHKMLFTGRPRHTYLYDPDRGDWSGRFAKPDSMSYDSCFYTLTLCTTPTGLYAWTQGGELLLFDPKGPAWQPTKLQGEKLPGSVVDNSTLTFDSERNRLLFARKEYGDETTFDGQIHAYDLATGAVSKLSPKNSEHAGRIPYLCQLRYDEANDLVLVGGTLPPDEKGIRRTPAYDCLTNAWISLRIGGHDPSDPKGRNVSLGMVYDPRRNLFWAVDTDSEVYVLRLSVGIGVRQPLQ